MALPADGHMHSEWSLDTRSGRGSMERMCARAVELGLPAVAFTDHLDLMAWQVESSDFEDVEKFKAFLTPGGALAPPPLDIDGYLECVDRCRMRFPDLQIITGAELGQPHRTAEAAAQIAGFGQLERVLGSLHGLSVGNQFFEPPGLYRLWPAADVIREYLAEVPRMIAGSDAFPLLAHIDYAVRYWPTKEAGPYDPTQFEDEFRQTLRIVAGSGRALELNVGGTIRPWVALWWSDEGGRAVTFGSDAHRPEWVGRNFPEAVAMAQALGYRPGPRPADFWTR